MRDYNWLHMHNEGKNEDTRGKERKGGDYLDVPTTSYPPILLICYLRFYCLKVSSAK